VNGNSDLPAMSVILVTPTNLGDLSPILGALAAQTSRQELELLLVTPADESATQISWPTGFHSVSVIQLPEITSRGSAAAGAVCVARGKIVALMENHVLPDLDWAEQILLAHRGSWVAVGPRIDGLNLRSWTSRAYRLVFYGRLTGRDQPEETDYLPWHNTTYKRRVLEPFVNQLDELLNHEERFHRLLLAQGHRFCYWPAARLRHVNVSRPGRALSLAFFTGRIFAAERDRHWALWRRLTYAVAWPLFPWIRLVLMQPDLRRIARHEPIWFLLPLVTLLLHAIALGEAVGYLFGAGGAGEWIERHEICPMKERLNRHDADRLENLVLR
jgi:hypothetical protein